MKWILIPRFSSSLHMQVLYMTSFRLRVYLNSHLMPPEVHLLYFFYIYVWGKINNDNERMGWYLFSRNATVMIPLSAMPPLASIIWKKFPHYLFNCNGDVTVDFRWLDSHTHTRTFIYIPIVLYFSYAFSHTFGWSHVDDIRNEMRGIFWDDVA